MHRADRVLGTILEALNHLLDLVGRGLGPAGQGAHLIGDHRKATPHFTGPRRLDGGVERQQVGLFGNAADHRQHLVDGGDLLREIGHRIRRLADVAGHPLDMGDGLAHHRARLHGLAARTLRRLRRVAGVARDLLHGQPHFMHGRGDHIGHLVLAPGTPGGIVHHMRHLPHRRAQLLTGFQHIADQTAQAADEAVEATRQVAQLVGPAFVQPPRQIAAATANLDQGAGDLADGFDQPARQQHHQEEKEQRDAQADQAGGPHGSLGFAEYLGFRHFADENPAEALQWLRQRQEGFTIALETYRLPLAAQQASGRLAAHELGELGAVVVFALRVDLDAPVRTDEIDLAAFTEAKPADQLGHVPQAVAQPHDTQLPTVDADALIDEHRELSRGLVGVDFDTPVQIAVDQAVEPAFARIAAIQLPREPGFRVVMTAFEHGDGRRQRVLLLLYPVEIATHRGRLLVVLAIEQPILHQGIAGDTGSGRDRRRQRAFDVIADGRDIGWQRFADQVALSQPIDCRGIHQDDDQYAGQQGRAHTDHQLPLDTALHEAHGKFLVLVNLAGKIVYNK